MTKWYGNLNNRIMEQGKDAEEITVGMGVTEFYWSDRHAYEVTKVTDQKHITIREYKHIHKGEPYTNNWELVSDPTRPEIDLVKRGKYWYTYATVTKEDLEVRRRIVHRGDGLGERLLVAGKALNLSRIAYLCRN